AIHLEVVADPLSQNTRGKRPEALTELDLQVHLGLHSRAPGISEDAPGAQGARPELHPTAEPTDYLLVRQESRHFAGQLVGFQPSVHGSLTLQVLLDLIGSELRPQVRPAHAIRPDDGSSRREDACVAPRGAWR